MDKIWLKSYPQGVPAEVDIDHLPSLVALFEMACAKYAHKVAYISMGATLTYRQLDQRSREFAGTLTHVVGSTPPRQSPAVLARLFVGAGADIVLGGRRVIPARLTRAGYRFRYPTVEDALRASPAIR